MGMREPTNHHHHHTHTRATMTTDAPPPAPAALLARTCTHTHTHTHECERGGRCRHEARRATNFTMATPHTARPSPRAARTLVRARDLQVVHRAAVDDVAHDEALDGLVLGRLAPAAAATRALSPASDHAPPRRDAPAVRAHDRARVATAVLVATIIPSLLGHGDGPARARAAVRTREKGNQRPETCLA